jgi:hypothetical protein
MVIKSGTLRWAESVASIGVKKNEKGKAIPVTGLGGP